MQSLKIYFSFQRVKNKPHPTLLHRASASAASHNKYSRHRSDEITSQVTVANMQSMTGTDHRRRRAALLRSKILYVRAQRERFNRQIDSLVISGIRRNAIDGQLCKLTNSKGLFGCSSLIWCRGSTFIYLYAIFVFLICNGDGGSVKSSLDR